MPTLQQREQRKREEAIICSPCKQKLSPMVRTEGQKMKARKRSAGPETGGDAAMAGGRPQRRMRSKQPVGGLSAAAFASEVLPPDASEAKVRETSQESQDRRLRQHEEFVEENAAILRAAGKHAEAEAWLKSFGTEEVIDADASDGAPAAAPPAAGTELWSALDEPCKNLLRMSVPKEAWPQQKCSGKFGYTITNPAGSKIEVQLKKQAFLAKSSVSIGIEPKKNLVKWASHGSVEAAWAACKSLVAW